MAADLQEPGDVVVTFFRRLATGEVDVTVGERVGRADPVAQRRCLGLFWWAYRAFVQPEVPAGGVDVFGCNLEVRDALLSLRESNASLVGLLFWLGFRRETMPYERRPASTAPAAGASAESTATCRTAHSPSPTCRSRYSHGRRVGGSRLDRAGCGRPDHAACWADTVLGYTPIMLLLLFSTSMILLGLGIVGLVRVAHLREQQGPASVRPSVARDIPGR